MLPLTFTIDRFAKNWTPKHLKMSVAHAQEMKPLKVLSKALWRFELRLIINEEKVY